MRTVARVILSFIAGFVVAYIVVVTALFLHAHLNNIVDRDGGMSMGIVFLIGPLAGLLGAIAAAIVIPILLAQRETQRETAAPRPPEQHRLSPAARAGIAAVLWFAAGYAVTWAAFQLAFGNIFQTYEAALAAGLSRYAVGLAAAALGAWRVLRKARLEAA